MRMGPAQPVDSPPSRMHDLEDWSEPTLYDVDRSIPQVDCKFISDIVRKRMEKRSEEYSARKQRLSEVHEKREALRKSCASGLLDMQKNNELALEEEAAEQECKQGFLYDDGWTLIDLRTVNEVTSWGMIEGAKILPAHELWEALRMTDSDFSANFGFPKPQKEDRIIFYCQHGPRSLMAAQIASFLGYKQVLQFRDGYFHWSKQFNIMTRRFMRMEQESGFVEEKAALFEASKQLGREIAPEMNDLIEAEVKPLRIDTTRSRGKLQIPIPPCVQLHQGRLVDAAALPSTSKSDEEGKKDKGTWEIPVAETAFESGLIEGDEPIVPGRPVDGPFHAPPKGSTSTFEDFRGSNLSGSFPL